MSDRRHVPRLDSLRAFAVLSVLFYHLSPVAVPWGFVGVDIFFNLSGFLMVWLVLHMDRPSMGFSVRTFLLRRFWRIFPPLVTTILVTLIASTFLFSPSHLENTAKSALAALVAVSNIHFFGEIGYFDVSSAVKPLLHTWSLGVEVQFYVLFAAVLWIFGTRAIPIVAAVAGGISLLLYGYVIVVDGVWSGPLPTFHDDPPAAVFYLPQYRIFQFAAGALAACFLIAGRNTGHLSELFGYVFLLGGIAVASTQDLATYASLAISLGMMLLLIRSDSLDRLSRIPVVAYLARISYQLYLAHWPVIVIYQYVRLEPLSPLGMVLCGAISLVLGDLLFRITNPLRQKAA